MEMENHNYTNQIDRLLNGKLSAKERASLQETVARQPELEQAVKTQLLEREAIKLMLQEDYKAKIKTWRAEASNSTNNIAKERTLQPQSRMRSLRPILSAAASILLLLVAGFWFADNSYSNHSLLSEAYLEAGGLGDKGGTELDDNLQKGLQAFFDNNNYSLAIDYFQQAGNSVDAQYYLGHSHYKLGQYTEAVGYFEKVLTQTELPAYINSSKLEYNRLLAQVGAGDTGAKFEQNLENLIQNGQAPFNQKAQNLKDKLGSFWRNLVF